MPFFDALPDWSKHWRGMPEFAQKDLAPYQTVHVHFRSAEDRQAFAELMGRAMTYRTRSVWYPKEVIGRYADKRFRAESASESNPRYPVYVPSKGRWETCLTMRALEKIGVPYRAVVESQEFDAYAKVLGDDKLLELPHRDKGLVVTRNWIWDHAQASGVKRFWTMDDNIRAFYRLHNNLKTPVADGAVLRVMEDFVERYENVPIAGMNYFMFASRKTVVPPFYLNTRVYSNMLIDANVMDLRGRPYRNEGFYNDDTDLCLRVLKDGLCTVLFNAFLIEKSVTMTVKGGMTPHYQGEGRLKMAEELRDKHPDVVTIARKWDRWQHHVDYSRFARNKLKPKVQLESLPDVDNYGMFLERDDSRLLLIGQAPSQNGDPNRPLEGKIGARLSRLAGIEIDEYVERTERVNLFDRWTGKNGKGDAWDVKAAESRAGELLPLLAARRVIFVGRHVAAAFGCGNLPWLTWTENRDVGAEVAVIPHPSGIVLWWNEPENKAAASEFLRRAFALEQLDGESP